MNSASLPDGAPGLTGHIAACNRLDLSGVVPLVEGGRILAWPGPAVQDEFARLSRSFEMRDGAWAFAPACADIGARTRALAEVETALRARGAIRKNRGEAYALVGEWGEIPVALVDRSAAAALGMRCFGVHLNGYVRRPDGIHLWVGRRSKTKAVAPGKLDNMVAGGQPAALNLLDNLIKECGEEASLPPEVAARAVPAGLVRYCFTADEGVKPDTLYCYDLEMPDGAVPVPGDGEAEGFELWPVSRVLEVMAATWDFKFNVPLVILDFVLRHGLIEPDADPATYAALCLGLRRPFPTLA